MSNLDLSLYRSIEALADNDIPNPILRIDFFLHAVITGEECNIEPVTKTEEYLYALATGDESRLGLYGDSISLLEEYLEALRTGDMDNLREPRTREEIILYQAITGEDLGVEPVSRIETYLSMLQNAGGLDYILSTSTSASVIPLTNSINGRARVQEMCGNTLVNLGGKVNKQSNRYGLLLSSTMILKPSTLYTFIVTNLGNQSVQFYRNESVFNATTDRSKFVPANSTIVFTWETLSNLTDNGLIKSEMDNATQFSLDVVLLEGDWTNREIPSEYFEGMKSCGQDDENGHKIEILSKKDSDIVCDMNKDNTTISGSICKVENGFGFDLDIVGTVTKDDEGIMLADDAYLSVDAINIPKGEKTYHIDYKLINTKMYSSIITIGEQVTLQLTSFNSFVVRVNGGEHDLITESTLLPFDARECSFTIVVTNSNITVYQNSTFVISVDCNFSNYIDYKTKFCIGTRVYDNADRCSKKIKGFRLFNKAFTEEEVANISSKQILLNKKEILLNEPLRGLPNGVQDRIVYLDENTTPIAPEGKGLYLEKNVGEVFINNLHGLGSCFDTIIQNGITTSRVYISCEIVSPIFPNIRKGAFYGDFVTDKLPSKVVVPNIQTEHGIAIGKTSTGVSIRLVGSCYEECQEWLSNNPFVCQYALETPTYTKISDVNLTCYENATVYVDSGAVAPTKTVIRYPYKQPALFSL